MKKFFIFAFLILLISVSFGQGDGDGEDGDGEDVDGEDADGEDADGEDGDGEGDNDRPTSADDCDRIITGHCNPVPPPPVAPQPFGFSFGTQSIQSCDAQVNIPSLCKGIFADFKVTNTLISSNVNITRGNIDALNNSLNVYCNICLSYIRDYYQCMNQLEVFDIIQRVGCSKHEGGGYCSARYLEMEYMMGISGDDCNVTDVQSCTHGCYAYLNDTKEELGCCAVSLFNTTNSSYQNFISPRKFEVCGISLIGDPCPFTSLSGSVITSSTSNVIIIIVTLMLMLFAMF